MGTWGAGQVEEKAISRAEAVAETSIALADACKQPGRATGMVVANRTGMDRSDVRTFEAQTRAFAIEAIRLHRLLRIDPALWDVGRQLSRAANSVAANHRSMSRARSTREFAAKLQIVHEEADEAAHWLGIIREAVGDPQLTVSIAELMREAIRLRNFFGSARSTTRRRHFSS